MSDEYKYVTSLFVHGFHVEELEFNNGWSAQTKVYHHKRDWILVRSAGDGLSLEGALLSLVEEIEKALKP